MWVVHACVCVCVWVFRLAYLIAKDAAVFSTAFEQTVGKLHVKQKLGLRAHMYNYSIKYTRLYMYASIPSTAASRWQSQNITLL